MLKVYKSSAGAGKTYTLAGHYIDLLFSLRGRNRHRRILAVTFTKKATAEMKDRIIKSLSKLARGEKKDYALDLQNKYHLTDEQLSQQASDILVDLLQDYGAFAVSTIDSFFQQIIRSFAKELNLPGSYNLELDSTNILSSAVDDYFYDLPSDLHDERVSSLMQVVSDNIDDSKAWNPKDTILSISAELLKEAFQTYEKQLFEVLSQPDALKHFREQLVELQNGEDKCLRLSADAVLKYLSYMRILQDISMHISKANQQLNRLPLSETNALLLDVIAQQEEAPFVYDKIGTRISHFMIDEFQDTSRMQWHNFRPLIRETLARGESNLLVGDVKQSIYRWRNSDSSLLQEGVMRDFPHLVEDNLPHNWRSYKTIVEQNCQLFQQLAVLMQDAYNQKGKTASNRIIAMYSSVFQKTTKSDQGFYSIRFVEAKNKDVAYDAILSQLPPLIRDLLSRNIKAGRIALLVRRNAEAQILADTLLAAGIKVMSNEALLVTSSLEVRLVIDLIRLQIIPDDKILRFQTAYEYALVTGKDHKEALSWALHDAALPQIPVASSLEEQVQTIITCLKLGRNPSALPYLQALQDRIYDYTSKYAADAYSFLDWWDATGSKSNIRMQQTDDAVQILTIHKSKGLEYDAVIVPFCDWSVGGGNQRSIMWLHSDVEPFCRMPVVPVNYNDTLKDSIFRDDYLRELENLYIDNLNLTYVAFTRAKKELYVFAPYKMNKSGESLATMGGMLHKMLGDQLVDDKYEKGERVMHSSEENHSVPLDFFATDIPLGASLQVKLPSRDYFFREKENDLNSRVNLGSLMHELLCNMRYADDMDQVDKMLREGKLREEDLPVIHTELDRFRHLVASTDWFDPKWHVISEQDILLQDGSVRRPDRVMICGNKAMVVDWKFGYAQPEQYDEQVREYMRLIGEMGYEVSGYLCFVNLRLIKQVTL